MVFDIGSCVTESSRDPPGVIIDKPSPSSLCGARHVDVNDDMGSWNVFGIADDVIGNIVIPIIFVGTGLVVNVPVLKGGWPCRT